ncbi:MAG TPA: glutamine-hydrolyzing carbamoyl-phosphate synthase small subunit [Planctomycetes bacterium]|nr:glutamine-hydrolyzing carbamoyl-phosphate synthase small subunit [Planctomycetota bacterium]
MSSSPPTKALGGGARGGLALTDPVQDSATEEAKAAAAPSFKEFRGLEHPSARGDALLILSDGTEISGQAFGGRRSVSGEVVFATGMVGYPESLTDPSYRGQLLTLTYPLIGNYGVPPSSEGDPLVSGFESGKIQASALVISTLSRDFSHWQSTRSLDSWLKEEGIPGIEGVDVRALTQRLREHGTMTAKLIIEGDKDADDVFNGAFVDPGKRNLVAEVSVREPVLHSCGVSGAPRILLVDCGAKANIARSLLRRHVDVLQVPWDHDFVGEKGEAVLVSNGPGDPVRADRTVENLRRAICEDRPVMGICLGNQLLALAAGARTYKLQFGHRSQNQPCVEVGERRCLITSQNHGYAVDGEKLPGQWREWFRNANDGSNEGIRHADRPYFSVQFHPEAHPGPRDAAFLFDRFLELVR